MLLNFSPLATLGEKVYLFNPQILANRASERNKNMAESKKHKPVKEQNDTPHVPPSDGPLL